MGGNKIDYPGEVIIKTSELATKIFFFNIVISIANAEFTTSDFKNFCLNTPMDRPEYMRIPVEYIIQEIIDEYNIQSLVNNVFVYVEITKGMYVITEARLFANELLAK